MTDQKAHRISVSNHYFRLTTEGIRLLSNKYHSYFSLGEVFEDRVERVGDLVNCYDIEDMRNHLRIIPTEGEVTIDFTIYRASELAIEAACVALGEALGRTISMPDALSLVMFDLIVERNATEVLTKLGLTAIEAESYRISLKRKNPNVIPIGRYLR